MTRKAIIAIFLFMGILIAAGISGAEEYLLPISAISLALIIYDLDIPKLVIGQRSSALNLTIALLGGLLQATMPLTELGIPLRITISASFVIVSPIILSIILWKKFDWNSENLNRIYSRAMRKEQVNDPSILRKKVILFRKIQVTSSDYVRILVLTSLTLQIFFIAVLVSFLVIFLSHIVIMEYSMFFLFVLWGVGSSLKKLPARWRGIFEIGESQERKTWILLLLSFSTLRGMYYLAIFIASMFFACIGVFLWGVFLYGGVSLALTGLSGTLPDLLSVVHLVLVWLSTFALLAYFVYPIYLLMKLYEAFVMTFRKVSRPEGAGTRLLPLPSFCLAVSIALAFTIGFNLYLFDRTSTLFYWMMAIAWLVWLGVFWSRHKGRYKVVTVRMRSILELGLGIYTVPFYLLLGEATFLMIFLLLAFYIVFKGLLVAREETSKKEEKKMNFVTILFLFVLATFFLVNEEYRSLVILPLLGIFFMAVLFLPKAYRDKIIKKLLFIEEVESESC